MPNEFLWYGTKEGFVVTQGYASKDLLDAHISDVVSVCGIEMDHTTVGPSQLKLNARIHPNEYIRNCSRYWNKLEKLNKILLSIQQDIFLELSLGKEFNNQVYFNLVVAAQLISHQLGELKLPPATV